VRGEQTYRFVVRGQRAVEPLANLIGQMGVLSEGEQTVITGRIVDQSHLRGVLDSITDLGLQLVAMERLGPVRPPTAGGGEDA
jgi:hypothetical protein